MLFKNYNNILDVERAEEPQDIQWENLGISKTNKFGRRIFTNLFSLFLIIIGFLVILAINYLKKSYYDKSGAYDSNSDLNFSVTVKLYCLTAAATVVIQVINIILIVFIRKFGALEKWSDFSKLNFSICYKLTFA